MLTRRDLIKYAICSGALLCSGPLLTNCSGLKRGDLPDPGADATAMPHLDESVRQILGLASLAPSGHNTQPWRVRMLSGHDMIIQADENRTLPCVDPDRRELLLSLGAFVENAVIAAQAAGYSPEVRVLANAPDDGDVVRLTLHRDTPRSHPLHVLKARRTVKHGLRPEKLSTSDITALTKATEGGLHYFPSTGSHAACIAEAALETFRRQTDRDESQKELVRWIRLSNRDAQRRCDGLTTEGMEITGLKGWFVRRFVSPEDFLKPAYRRQSIEMTADLVKEGAGWMVLTSSGETVADLIETGRRFERLALLACQRNIAIHPMTQILEEPYGREQIVGNHSRGFTPQFILRVGYLDRYPAPVSLRRPVSAFVMQTN